jgi:hypothetical protein
VVLRWGSYVAVLADKAKPVWAEAHSPEVSRICDSEMARINIEASAALAEWRFELARSDYSSRWSRILEGESSVPRRVRSASSTRRVA